MAVKCSNFCGQIKYNVLYVFKTIQAFLDEYDLRNQQNPPFSKLHIELLEQFKVNFHKLYQTLAPKRSN